LTISLRRLAKRISSEGQIIHYECIHRKKSEHIRGTIVNVRVAVYILTLLLLAIVVGSLLTNSAGRARPAANFANWVTPEPNNLSHVFPPDRLVVIRTRPNLEDTDAAPFSRTIDNPAKVQQVYNDISALPVATGTYSCPPDLGITYSLDFYVGVFLLLTAEYEPTGCAFVTLPDGITRSALHNVFENKLVAGLDVSEKSFFGFE
jgi:hypothetical protein